MQSESIGDSTSRERHSVPREALRTSVKDASLVLLTRWEPGSLWWFRPRWNLVSVSSVELKSFAGRETELSVTLFFLELSEPCFL